MNGVVDNNKKKPLQLDKYNCKSNIEKNKETRIYTTVASHSHCVTHTITILPSIVYIFNRIRKNTFFVVFVLVARFDFVYKLSGVCI